MKKIDTNTAQAGLLVAMVLFAGCAAEMTDTSGSASQGVGAQLVSQDQARQLTAQYRRKASDLRDLAARTEWEAQWYESQFGVNDQEATRRRTQASQLWAAAEQADQLAIDYRRQVPHGQIQ